MTTMSEKIAFVKANKNLVSSVKLTNAKIAGLTEDAVDALVTEIQAHADFKPEETTVATTSTSVPVLELEGVEHTENFGAVLYLPYIGRSKSQNPKFAYGNSFVVVNSDLRLKAMNLEVGQVFALKADTIQLSDKGYYTGRVNWSADEKITSLNDQIDKFQEKLSQASARHALKYKMSLKDAEAEITAQSKAKDIEAVELPEINF
jgi:hypothetical protein